MFGRLAAATRTQKRSITKLVGVNQMYKPDPKPLPSFNFKDTSSAKIDLTKHKQKEWTSEDIANAREEHVMYSWMPKTLGDDITIVAERGEGPFLFDRKGNKYLDWSSGAVCSNLGHTVVDSVKQAINEQMEKTCFVYGDLYTTEARARLSSLLAEVFPGKLNSFLFYNSGAEANEAAIRLARHYTGRNKVMTRHRSYHGGTMATLHMTGDFRTHLVSKPAATGFVKMFDPTPMTMEWAGENESEGAHVERCLQLLQEQLVHENPESVACIVLESITGTNGWLIPPTRYMQGVRALCDHYGILMICDEVMAGFGRTGKMFGFQNFEGVEPDIVTFAKGVSSSVQPISGVAMCDSVKEYFRNNAVPYGSTFCAHPVGLAAAYANVQYLLENDIVGNAKALETVHAECMSELVQKFQMVKAARVIGCAGGMDIINPEGKFMDAKTMLEMRKSFRDSKPLGLTTLARDHFIHCTPPLNVEPEVVREGYAIMGRTFEKFQK